jgi:alpha-glucosidase
MKLKYFKSIWVLSLMSMMSMNGQSIMSPNNKIKVDIKVDSTISYKVSYDENELSAYNTIALSLKNIPTLGKYPKLKKVSKRSVDKMVNPVYGMASSYQDNYNEIKLSFKDHFTVSFRVYNSGIAYRFSTNFSSPIIVVEETAEFNFKNDVKVWAQSGKGFGNWYEDSYIHDAISTLSGGTKASLPLLVDLPVKIAILESGLSDYPGMLLQYNGKNGLSGTFPRFVLKDSLSGGTNFQRNPYEFANYIAKTKGERSFPWRIMVIAEQDKDLLYNNLSFLLAEESQIKDSSWIKPGLVAWDWYSGNNLTGVDFKTGYNTNTYKYFIDFAANNGIEYIMMDEGWSDQMDLLKLNDGSVVTADGLNLTANLDMYEIINYAKDKNVGIFLWCVWHTLDKQMSEALDQFQKWGISGVKVDFMSRDDQYVVNFYERLAKETAKRKMLVDFHGSFTPKGLERKYPNVLNYEAVKGLEWNKFSDLGTPENLTHIPFIRMLAGPMDYTPGGMYNVSKSDFRISMQRPMTQGTRCQQLALFTILYAPLEMLADSPTTYEKEPEILSYLSKTPTVWHETIPLDGKLGDYAVIARRHGNSWYVGGITDDENRNITINFNFLTEGNKYKMTLFSDGVNADRIGNDYKMITNEKSSNDTLTIEMQSGGGFAMKFDLLD